MRILIYGMNFSPEAVGIGKYTGEMADWLATRGHQVRVVTTPPHYPQWRVQPGYRNLHYSREILFPEDGFGADSGTQLSSSSAIEVFRCPIWIPKSPKGASRLLLLSSFALTSWPILLRQIAWHPDAVLMIEPTLFCALPTLTVARLSRAKTWLHVQDFEVDAAFELGDLSSSILRDWAYALERFLMRRFDRVSTISDRMVGRLIAKGVHKSRSKLFSNWVDTSAIYPLRSPGPFRPELGIPDSNIVALYAGNMGKKQGLELLAEASRRLAARPDIQFVFSGDGSQRGAFIASLEGARNVIFLPIQPANRLNDLLNLADIHLLPQRADAADLLMPSKLTGMMASGRAIVATASPGTQLGTVLEGRGIVSPPGDLNAFVSAIIRFADDPDLREQMGDSARQYATNHLERERVLRGFEQSLLEVCGKSTLADQVRPPAGQNGEAGVDDFTLARRMAGDD